MLNWGWSHITKNNQTVFHKLFFAIPTLYFLPLWYHFFKGGAWPWLISFFLLFFLIFILLIWDPPRVGRAKETRLVAERACRRFSFSSSWDLREHASCAVRLRYRTSSSTSYYCCRFCWSEFLFFFGAVPCPWHCYGPSVDCTSASR